MSQTVRGKSAERSWVLVPLLIASGCGSASDAQAPAQPPVAASVTESQVSGPAASDAAAAVAQPESPATEVPPESTPAGSVSGTDTPDPIQPELLPLPEGTKVLHIGDSFAGALGKPLGELLEGQGVRSVLKHTDASYLTTWAWEGDLQKYLWKYNPDLVIVTLGANELGIAEPERRERTVKKIVATIGERPCLWVGIPLWSEKHNGLLEVIQQSASPCVYYDTNRLQDAAAMPRIADGIHPTSSAREQWAEKVLAWMTEHREPQAGHPWHLAP